MEYIIVFINTHQALKCEKILNLYNVENIVLPTPSYITNSCGISIGISQENLIKIKELANNNMDFEYRFIFDVKNKLILN